MGVVTLSWRTSIHHDCKSRFTSVRVLLAVPVRLHPVDPLANTKKVGGIILGWLLSMDSETSPIPAKVKSLLMTCITPLRYGLPCAVCRVFRRGVNMPTGLVIWVVVTDLSPTRAVSVLTPRSPLSNAKNLKIVPNGTWVVVRFPGWVDRRELNVPFVPTDR